jgi:cell division septation protein DedD
MTDEGLREIQLDGKQLVFLFMAATVVAVVIFLCGVMVGRGVPTRPGAMDAEEQISLDPTISSENAPTRVATGGNGPIAAQEDLSYDNILGNSGTSGDTLRPVSEVVIERPVAQPAVATPPAVAPKPAPVAAPAPRAALAPRPSAPARAPARTQVDLTEPRGNGYVVQVAAVQKRDEANTIARRLSGKGYPAFVTTSGSNFRVRVGKYANRREAETVANRLEREERIEPWVTR